MKVYLINPPASNGVKIVREGRCMQRKGAWTSVWPPISLCLIAAFLDNDGHEIKLDDCIVDEIDFVQLQSKIDKFKPNIVIINTATPSINSDLKVAVLAKKINNKCKTIAFGIHVTALPEETLKMEPALDCIVRGEPEITIRNIIKNNTFKNIQGISYKNDKKIIHNPPRTFIKNIDQLPFPAWQYIKRDRYLMPFRNKPFLLIATGRGCPYQCVFCADRTFYGSKLRLRSPHSIVNEIQWAGKKFGIKDFLFWSESFTINSQFANKVAEEIIQRNLKVRWVCNSRVDNVNYRLLKKFSQAGCWMIGYGIESGNQEILNKMNKNVTLQQIKRAVRDAHRAGIEVTGHCVIGYPGESPQNIEQTVKFVKDINLDFVQFYCAVPFPGSELYNLAKNSNWLTTSDWHFYEQNFCVISTPYITANEIMKLRNKAYISFYLRPKIIMQTINRIHSFKDIKQFFVMIKDFITWI